MLHRIYTITVSVTLACSFAVAQTEQDRLHIISQTNLAALEAIRDKDKKNQAKWAAKNLHKKVSSLIKNKDGTVRYFSGYDEEGNPIYDEDDNIDAARSSKVDVLWEGGISGFNLTGSGVEIGQWEAGGVARLNHQEYAGRLRLGENKTEKDHAVHTAGTMIGSGVVSKARGMAPEATIVSWRSDNVNGEMAEFASEGGIVVNISFSSGNPRGNVPDYGTYSLLSQKWDQITYNAPYLTICKSAGNNRNDPPTPPNPGDNGYDIMYGRAAAKNIITVGAVEDVSNYTGPESVTQTEFSNWGPTDDWRIKPDITANGTDVYSPWGPSNTSYKVESGTSMATPVVTGTIALLQQMYKDLNGVYMKSATVKALLIGTTDEVGGADGPDFQSGWGLLNAERAAHTIHNRGKSAQIEEKVLENGSNYSLDVKSDGASATVLTLAWTDPRGEVTTEEDDLTPTLVNDLDVRIVGSGGPYLPWVMVPGPGSDNFTGAAQKGDNFRDNVEKIEAQLPKGEYQVVVTHKHSLSAGSQSFSLVITELAKGQTPVLNQRRVQDPELFLNPLGGTMTIEFSETPQENMAIKIWNLSGRLVKEKVIHGKTSTIDVSTLPEGIYMVKIGNGKGGFVRTIIVSK